MQAATMTPGWNLTTIYVGDWTRAVEEAQCERDDWPTVWRPTEYIVFKHILRGFRQQIERRIEKAEQMRRDEHFHFVSLVYRTFRYYVAFHAELSHMARIEVVAARMKLTPQQVQYAIVDAEQMGAGEA